MTTETLTGTPTRHAERGPVMPASGSSACAAGIVRSPRRSPNYVCAACFGPLEVAYDLSHRRPVRLGHDRRSPARHLALPEPFRSRHCRPAGWRSAHPLITADRLGPTLGIDRLWPGTTRATRPCRSRPGRGSRDASRRVRLEASPAPRPAPAGDGRAAAAIGLPAHVHPGRLEPAKIDHALAYGATVVPIDGTYDDVNRLCLEVADELAGAVNVNLRLHHAEGSKTLAFEIVRRSATPARRHRRRSHRARCIRSWPRDLTSSRRRLIMTPVRFVGGQPPAALRSPRRSPPGRMSPSRSAS
jgi:threonine synthase